MDGTPSIDWSAPSTWLGVLLASVAIVIVLGVVLGLRRHVIVFRNFDDVALVFFSQFFCCLALFSLPLVAIGEGMLLFTGALSVIGVGLFLWAIGRTFFDNESEIGPFALALVTKLLFSWLIILSIGNVLNPGGSTGTQRRKQRGSGLVSLFVVVPLVSALVLDPLSGVYSPRWLKRPLAARWGTP